MPLKKGKSKSLIEMYKDRGYLDPRAEQRLFVGMLHDCHELLKVEK